MLRADGKTYPQEGVYSRADFETYFFTTASATIIGILHAEVLTTPPSSLQEAAAGRDWAACVGGCFYMLVPLTSNTMPKETDGSKPNYPGRSSHNCNGGFIVPPKSRGLAIGHGLAQAFCVYVPKLGFRASVFNLVYASESRFFRDRTWSSCCDVLTHRQRGVHQTLGEVRFHQSRHDPSSWSAEDWSKWRGGVCRRAYHLEVVRLDHHRGQEVSHTHALIHIVPSCNERGTSGKPG